jgi:hypothetical protein
MGDRRGPYMALVGRPEVHLEDLGVDWIILKWDFKWDGEEWTGLIWLSLGTCGGLL